MPGMHDVYLPHAEDVLLRHFAPVGGVGKIGSPKKHLVYYAESIAQNKDYLEAVEQGLPLTKVNLTLGTQIEKDERFWVVSALLGLFYAEGDDATGRRRLFGQLLDRAGLTPPGGAVGWEDALRGPLRLYFEANLPSPKPYQYWLKQNLDDHVITPYLRAVAETTNPLEGPTNVDAILLAPDTGTAVVFEAKVLSDVSTQVRFDFTRNQLARIIDVTLEKNPKLLGELDKREPERTYFALLTPRTLSPQNPTAGAKESRLYGWLMPAYQDRNDDLLNQHLPHRDRATLARVRSRLGWATWEDCDEISPGACPWLQARIQSQATPEEL